MILLIGNAEFDDVSIPVKGKSEWGIDTLTRKMRGAREFLPDFIDSLEQGQELDGYFLQSWEPDDDPVFATITLLYKGLLGGATPVPRIETFIQTASGNTSASFVSENGGLGRVYRVIPQYTQPTELDNNGDIVESIVVAKRSIYTTSAQMEYTYDAVQSHYRYITEGQSNSPRYSEVMSNFEPTIKTLRGSTGDGFIFGMNNAAVFFPQLKPEIQERVVGFSASPVIGTPYFECEDVVRKDLSNQPVRFPS